MTLTRKQREVLDALSFLVSQGVPPTVREVGQVLGLNAASTVHKHLRALERAGYIETSGKAGGVRLVRGVGIPVVGSIAAGEPIDNPDDAEPGEGLYGFPEVGIPPAIFLSGAGPGDVVALRIVGDSMVEAGILDGDLVMIRRQPQVEEGEIAAVTIDGAGTLKRWSGRAGQRKSIRLSPENERFEPIEIRAEDQKDVRIFGKYLGLIRGDHLLIQ